MNNLTEATINADEDIIEFRNKLLVLFNELKFSVMDSVSYTTKMSDLIRNIYYKEKSFTIYVGMQNKENLLIKIYLEHLLSSYKKNTTLKLHFSQANNEKYISILFPIKSEQRWDTDFFIALKEKIIIQSKSNLIKEINHKNEELKKLLDDLKKSSSLIQSEKMRALGVLTAGVAHELNNPMMGILNFIQYCIKKTDPTDKRFEALKDAEHETKRCIDIVTNLLTFSHLEKEGQEKFRPVNVASLATRVIKILSYRLRNEGVTVSLNKDENLPVVMGHENRLQQVILNLVTNALDAMKTTKNKCLMVAIQSRNNYLKIVVSDSGEGMDEETKEKIFEPFFTTKPAGSGTGLGLAVCESIIKEHAGTISCHSEKNKGTNFSILLPITEGETYE